MKWFSKLFSTLPKRLATATAIALAVLIPATTMAADVSIEGTMGVANKTAGDTTYSKSINAKYNDVVKVEVYYHNRELPDSGKIAQNLRVKINIPSTPGTAQTQTATISGDNTNTVTATTSVTLDRADAYLQYLPGSAVWRHNTGTNDAPNWVDTVISDGVVTSGTGVVLENEKPCYNFSATVTVLARVMVPGVSVDKYVRAKGSTEWVRSMAGQPGQTVQYQIAYKNTGNTTQSDVAFRDQLPAGVTYVPGSAKLKNTNFPNGTAISDSIVASNGVIVGTYLPGGAGYVMFEAVLPTVDKLACGSNLLRNLAFVQPKGMNYYYNTADVTVNKTCTTPTPVYSCDDLTVTKGDNRTVTATVKYTAKDGATYKNTTLVWGDSKQDVITGTTGTHTYAADGTYTVKANMLFSVNGVDKAPAVNAACSKTVTFSTTSKTPSVKIEKMVEKSVVNVNEEFKYTVRVTNDGEVDLTNVKVHDTPADASNIKLVSANGVGSISGNTWSYTIPSLKVGESKSFTLTAKVTAYTEGNLVNTACVNAPEVNPENPAKDDDCSSVPVTVKKPVTPVYSCDALTLTAGANRTLTAKVDYTGKDGAKLKMVTYNWGDGATPLVTDKTTATHTYGSDGTFSVSLKLLFSVNGTDKYAAENQSCVKSVTFTTPTPPTQKPDSPQVLPDTGAGSVIGLFGLVSVLSALAYRLFLSRKPAR
ncbi:DUF11 domain-containing protein [Candidatus Saccharibacteria bacterium]|nr:MAG: DUF11 domain-containing protein [Candidatus Saccharibacteria bacterium]